MARTEISCSIDRLGRFSRAIPGYQYLPAVVLSLGLFLAAAESILAADGCFSYEPARVELTGKVSKKQAFGPPNYGEDPAHDRRETYLVLVLNAPLCVTGDPKSPTNNESETDVREVQLVFAPGQSIRRSWLNRQVSVSGTLFHAITGHHRTKVLIQVIGTRLAPALKAKDR
jgi:hypothetical protein